MFVYFKLGNIMNARIQANLEETFIDFYGC